MHCGGQLNLCFPITRLLKWPAIDSRLGSPKTEAMSEADSIPDPPKPEQIRLQPLLLLLVNCFLRPGFLPAEEPG